MGQDSSFLERHFKWVIASLLGIRIGLAAVLPIVADESYYALWAQHLDWSFVDHPGMIAWINWGFISIFQDPLMSIRLASLATLCVSLIFIYKTARLLLAEAQAKQVALLYLLIPYNFVIGISMQVEQALLMFATLSLYCFIQYCQTQKSKWLYGLAISSGLMCLSKYTAILLIAGFLLTLVQRKQLKQCLQTKAFWGSFALFLAVLFPLLYWNSQHDWITFLFHAGRVGQGRYFDYTLEFLGSQILYLSPVLLAWLLMSCRKPKLSQDARTMLLLTTCIFIPFLLLSIKTRVWGHWTALMTIPMTVFLGLKFRQQLHKINIGMLIFNAVLLIVLMTMLPINNPSVIFSNYTIRSVLLPLTPPQPGTLHLYGDEHGSVGILSYYARQKTYFPRGIFENKSAWGNAQFRQWPQPPIQKGDTVIFFASNTQDHEQSLKTHFETVSQLPFSFTLLEGHISQKKLWVCKGAKSRFVF